MAPGEWERRSRLVTIKVADFEFEALSSLAEVTGLTKSRRGAVKVPRAAPESDNREHPEDDRFVQGELFFHNE